MSDEAATPSPGKVRDHADPGDETQRNFRYQHAYGVILLIGAAQGGLAYVSIWCEHHEDFLAERQDGLYDACQIKTAKPEDGAWVWSREGLRHSVKRFTQLHRRFPGRIGSFLFVSNAECLASHAAKEEVRSPLRLVEAIGRPLTEGLRKAFDELKTYCECDDSELEYVLERLRFVKGPGRDSFDDEIAHTHLSSLDACRAMTAAQRDRCLDALVQVVYRASSLVVRDPARHWCGVTGEDGADPYLRSKRVNVTAVAEVLSEIAASPFSYAPTTRPLPLGDGDGRMTVLEQKLVRGGLAEYVDLVRGRAVSAERHLIELAHLRPEEIDAMLNQITAVVKGECDEARLDASQQPEPYGRQMLSDVHRRLKRVADERADMVYRQQYEVLVGVAGLLAEDCRVWWSEQFELKATP
jgi:hypothetical protein